MKSILLNIFASVFEFLDRRWRRQALWICTGPLIIGLISKSVATGIVLLIPAMMVYLLWVTLGMQILTEKRSKSLLLETLSNKIPDLTDVSMNQDFRDSEIHMGLFTKAGFMRQKAENPYAFRSIPGFFRRFSLDTRFQVALVEIQGEKFVRKQYTSSDYKFFQALRNNLIVRKLGITPKLRYVSVPDRSTWTEFVDGPSLHYLCKNDLIGQVEKTGFAGKLIEFKSLLHQLGLCNLDLHLGNILVRRYDNGAMLIDIDEAKHYLSSSFLYQLYCIKDQKRVDRPVNRLTGSKTKTQ